MYPKPRPTQRQGSDDNDADSPIGETRAALPFHAYGAPPVLTLSISSHHRLQVGNNVLFLLLSCLSSYCKRVQLLNDVEETFKEGEKHIITMSQFPLTPPVSFFLDRDA